MKSARGEVKKQQVKLKVWKSLKPVKKNHMKKKPAQCKTAQQKKKTGWSLSLGGHCSGWESLSLAASKIGLEDYQIDMKFSSDVEPSCRRLIQHRHPDATVLKSVIGCKHGELPQVDIFCSGFPCQPFSAQGLGKGRQDTRGKIGFEVVKYIVAKKPPGFILENVKRLASPRHDAVLTALTKTLQEITDSDGKQTYTLHMKVVDTRDHGIPQRRQRLYIIGIARTNTCGVVTYLLLPY